MTKRAESLVRNAAVTLATVGWAGAASAGGLIIPGYGSQGQPRVGAFVAKADDPSALYYNPAGFARQRGTSVQVSLNLIDFDQRVARTGSYETPELGAADPWAGTPYPVAEDASRPSIGIGGFQGIPSIMVTSDLGRRTPLVFGFGLIAEHGFPTRSMGADYTFEDPTTPPPPNRYGKVEQDVMAVFPSLAAGYSFGKLDVGARVSWGVGHLDATTYLWGVRNYEEDIHQDARFQISASDYFIPVAQLGLLYRVSPSIELGAQWTSPRNVNGVGDGTAEVGSKVGVEGIRDTVEPITGPEAACADGGTLTALKSCIYFSVPQTATIGARYVLRDGAGRERGDLELDVQWEDWSNASDIRVVVDGRSGLLTRPLEESIIRHGFKDTFSFRLGGAYGIPVRDDVLTLRGGVAYDTRTADQQFTRADLDGIQRTTFGAGVGYTTGRMRFDLGGGYVYEPTRTVADDCNPTAMAPGCDGEGGETPVTDRDRPDPLQPLTGPQNQVESSFNAGTYEQSYLLLSLGVTYAF